MSDLRYFSNLALIISPKDGAKIKEKTPIDIHFCKACNYHFRIILETRITGDYFLECPNCKRHHYRHFKNGEAIHCDIDKTHDTPIVLRGI